MTEPDEPTERSRPAVYARLAADAEHRFIQHAPSRWSHRLGRLLVAAIVVVILVMVNQVHPW